MDKCYVLTLTNHESVVVNSWHVTADKEATNGCTQVTDITRNLAAADLLADIRQAVIDAQVKS